MFATYLLRELRRRARQAVFIGLGLAVGVGLVISVTAASAGVRTAQGKVLQSLYGVGTDVTVTTAPTAEQGGPLGFGVRSGDGDDARPKAGTTFTRDDLRAGQLGAISAATAAKIATLNGVADSTAALTLTDTRVTGKVPNASSFEVGPPDSGTRSGSSGDGGGGPPTFQSNFKISSFTVTGVEVADAGLGTLSSAKVTSGRAFGSDDATSDVALVTSDYAKAHDLAVDSTVTVADKKFTVVGVLTVARGASTTDVYIPLARAQKLADMTGKVNTVYVSAADNTQIAAVAKEIKATMPKATVTTSSDLAKQVTGSLSSASSLANNLGRWLSVAVLAAAFLLASLLTLSAVTRRVREFGTLKALGWRSRRIVAQVMGESLVIGAVGAVVGVALGFLGAAVITAVAPSLTATTGTASNAATTSVTGPGPGFAPPDGGPLGQAASAAHTVAVHLSASVTPKAVVLAVALALAGGLLAGAVGGWRAARLRPATALARVA